MGPLEQLLYTTIAGHDPTEVLDGVCLCGEVLGDTDGTTFHLARVLAETIEANLKEIV